jgi:hypothetical protein
LVLRKVWAFHTALEIFRLHRGEVEEHDDEPMVAQLLGFGHDDCLAAGGSGGEAAHGGLLERRSHVDALEIKGRDLLLFAVLEDFEVALFKVLHELAGFGVARHHVSKDQIGVGLEHESALRRGGNLAGRLRGKRRQTGSGQRQQRKRCARPLQPASHELLSATIRPFSTRRQAKS